MKLAEKIICWPIAAWIKMWELVFFFPIYWIVSLREWANKGGWR